MYRIGITFVADICIAEIFTSNQPMEEVAKTWIDRYNADNTESMMHLVNVILQCAGCDLKITEDDANDPDHVPSRMTDLQEEYRGKALAEYPLVAKGKAGHALRAALIEFFRCILRVMYETNVLFDDMALYENIELWVTTMTSSNLRPFRHTSTLIALTITTALCEISLGLSQATADARTQLESEKKRKSNKATIAALQEKVEQGVARGEQCTEWIKAWFDQVFIHRYRDIDAKIRTDCAEALGQWIVTSPSMFLEGTYLRYLGWVLSDVSVPTRHQALVQLDHIMNSIGEKGALREFIERFRSRIVEMAERDSDVGVRISAIDLLDLLREAGMLAPDDIDTIGQLIFDSEARVRKAVVGFFAENINDLYESKVEDIGGTDVLKEVVAEDDEDGDSPCKEWIKFKCIAEVLHSYDATRQDGDDEDVEGDGAFEDDLVQTANIASRFSFVSQSLYDEIPELKEWDKLAGYLLFDHSVAVDPRAKSADGQIALRESFKLDEKEEAILLEILDASVKQSLSHPEDHGKKGRKLTKAEEKEIQDNAARRLAVIIPRLLSKFGAKPRTIVAVLRLERLLNLNIFQALRMEATAYPELLREIGVQFKGHSDQRVLNEARATILQAQSYEELEEVTQESIQSIWEETVQTMASSLQNFSKSAGLSARGDLSVEHLIAIDSTAMHLAKLSSVVNPIASFEAVPKATKASKGSNKAKTQPLIDSLIELIGRGVLQQIDEEIDDLEDAFVGSICRTVLFYFMWKVQGYKNKSRAGRPAAIPEEEYDPLKARLEAFKDALYNVFSTRGTLDELRLISSCTLLDVCTLFSTLLPPRNSSSSTASADPETSQLRALTPELPPAIQAELLQLFSVAEKQYAKKSGRELASPDADEEPEDAAEEEPKDADDEEEDEREAALTEEDRAGETLKSEVRMCQLAGKLVAAVLVGSVGQKVKVRLRRNRARLGGNLKGIVAKLDEVTAKPKKKAGKGAGARAQAQAQTEAPKKQMLSAERVEDDEDDEEEEAEGEGHEGGDHAEEEELVEDVEPEEEQEEPVEAAEEADDDVMGD
jgi:cohesin complex subunit SA-1/2